MCVYVVFLNQQLNFFYTLAIIFLSQSLKFKQLFFVGLFGLYYDKQFIVDGF